VQKPAVLSHEQTAALLSPGLHALHALHYTLHLTPGDTVLVVNAASVSATLGKSMP
jgi:NADPH:quinone reductase-like Zn-dependent oxidoreductase